MTTVDWTVIAAAASTIAWIIWYFFADHTGLVAMSMPSDGTAANPLPGSAAGGRSGGGGPAQATIIVQGGYDPSVVRVKAGQPVRLIFDRQETSGCSEEVVFADFGIRRFLPAHQQTVIEVTPPKAGTYAFTCGMGMLRGKLVAE